MMTQILFYNLDFSSSIFMALVFLSGSWLFFDSWKNSNKLSSLLIRSLGFALISIFYLTRAAGINFEIINQYSTVIKTIGLIMILYSVMIEPILSLPNKKKGKSQAIIAWGIPAQSLFLINLFATIGICIRYFKKTHQGLEKQLKPIATFFIFFTIIELFQLAIFFANHSNNPLLINVFINYGYVWSLLRILEIIAGTIFFRWAWGYLRFRTNAQLFIIITSLSFLLSILTTFSFTFSIYKNLESDLIEGLKTNTRVFQYAIERLQFEALADAKAIAQNIAIRDALINTDNETLLKTAQDFMLSQNTNFLLIADANGQVIVRAEDNDLIGNNISESTTFQSAMKQIPLSNIVTKENALAPDVYIEAAAPILNRETETIGVSITGFIIDNPFVDEVKRVTNLDLSIFADNTRSATTLLSTDNKSRLIGTKENNKSVLDTVIMENNTYAGSLNILNQPFYSVYEPLRNYDNQTVGMISVGKPQSSLKETTENSIQYTFIVSTILTALTLIPAYLVSKYIEENITA